MLQLSVTQEKAKGKRELAVSERNRLVNSGLVPRSAAESRASVEADVNRRLAEEREKEEEEAEAARLAKGKGKATEGEREEDEVEDVG